MRTAASVAEERTERYRGREEEEKEKEKKKKKKREGSAATDLKMSGVFWW